MGKEIEAQKALIEDMKAEAKRKIHEHEIVVATSQEKDQTISKYHNKIGRCK